MESRERIGTNSPNGGPAWIQREQRVELEELGASPSVLATLAFFILWGGELATQWVILVPSLGRRWARWSENSRSGGRRERVFLFSPTLIFTLALTPWPPLLPG